MESFEKAERDMREGDRENLPDRQAAERNSVYKVAQDAREKWADDYKDEAKRTEDMVNSNRPADGQDRSNPVTAQSRGGRIPSARQENSQTYSNRREYGGEGKKENRLDETVSLNTDPIDQPTKLDNL